MSVSKISKFIYIALILVSLTGCRRTTHDIWDDTRTAGRHMGRGIRSLGGKHGDSREVQCREDFLRSKNDGADDDYSFMEFDPLPDQKYAPEVSMNIALAANEPGSKTSSVPGIDGFSDPANDPQLSGIFKTIYFPYNSSLVKGDSNLKIARQIGDYLKKNPNVFVFVEGHCDERGPEAYNLALGSRRANAVRSLLIKEGAKPENIFTVSYGKERPAESGRDEASWSKNRRAQFKIYKQ